MYKPTNNQAISLIRFYITLVFLYPFATIANAQERLKHYTPPNFYIGGALHGDTDSFASFEYRNVAQTEFNAITSTIYMGWGPWPTRFTQPNVSRLTRVIDWAAPRGLKVHGHSLVYPMSNRSLGWFQQLPNQEVAKYLGKFIDQVAGARAGQIWVWDVVNEVMADDSQTMDADGLRTKYKEYQAMGAGYVDFAFRRARQADPKALLILNDYGIRERNAKSTRLFEYAKKLKQNGVPIDGIGFQMHFTDVNELRPNLTSIQRNFRRFAQAGFQIFITEMDVCSLATRNPHPGQPGRSTPNQEQQQRQADYYSGILKIALREPACKSLLLWDYADDNSWLHATERNIGGLTPGTYTYPTPFWCGKNICPISRKPAYYSMLKTLKTTPAAVR